MKLSIKKKFLLLDNLRISREVYQGFENELNEFLEQFADVKELLQPDSGARPRATPLTDAQKQKLLELRSQILRAISATERLEGSMLGNLSMKDFHLG